MYFPFPFYSAYAYWLAFGVLSTSIHDIVVYHSHVLAAKIAALLALSHEPVAVLVHCIEFQQIVAEIYKV